ncbi:hypothetical protein B566_EDAN008109 [Ephemera danica]|nr:hypothetical protein B566_EDAN008109 [Ephemera danica]
MDTGVTTPFPDPASPNAGVYVMQYDIMDHKSDMSYMEDKLNLAMAREKLLLEELNQQRNTVKEQAKEMTKIGEAIQTLKREKVILKQELDVKCLELNQLKTNFERANEEIQHMKSRDQMYDALVTEVNQLEEKLASEVEEKGQLMKQIKSLQGSEKELYTLKNKFVEFAETRGKMHEAFVMEISQLKEKLASETNEKSQLMIKMEEVAERDRKLAAREIAVQAGENRIMHLEEVMKHVHEIEGEVQRLQTENKDLRTKLHQKLAKTDKVGAQSLKMYQDKIEEMHKFNVKCVIKITNLEAQLTKLGNPNSTLFKPTVASSGKSSRPATSVTGASCNETKDNFKSK